MVQFPIQPRRAITRITLAIMVGIIGGLAAILFRILIEFFHDIFFDYLLSLISFDLLGHNLSIILLPAIGGLIVAPIIAKIAIEAKGHGIPEIMESIHLHGGRIRGRVGFVKALASSITIGSGGSAGSEGPIGQISASLGSLIGQKLNLPERRIKLLTVCGVAAGIGATFNAPLGGAIFAMEVLLTEIETISATSIILSSVVGTTLAEIWLGPSPAFKLTPELSMYHPFSPPGHPIELLFYLTMGLIFGLIAILWVRILYLIEDFFDSLRINFYFKPAIGGLLTGVLGLFFIDYGILGAGYESVDVALAGRISLSLLILLGILKILSTSFTIGSGGSGGIFAPSLFIGAMFGGAFGLILNQIFPEIVKFPMAYALVGMGALFAGAAGAPLTCIIMIPEMAGNYFLIPAMMVACVSSYLVFSVFSRENIYTLKLVRRGIAIDVDHVLSEVKVRDIMTKKIDSVNEDMRIPDLIKKMLREGHTGYPVIKDNELIGIVTFRDLSEADMNERVGDICTREVFTIGPNASAQDAVRMLFDKGVGRLIVTDEKNPKKILGIISRTDILKAYQTMIRVRKSL
ncbi:MAG: chloride channel protein [Candidatus Altiarchaeales archaeon]|nr:MAG: chloride channel protein [Candidatus Altiarchaeales archaeon]HDO82073.1 CBS domain-containing protein [Candidatus Altiarchaeales archaeon]HEX54722.1 CBS domain-containing protein [Candidatus Altiarchaeales archaeon]